MLNKLKYKDIYFKHFKCDFEIIENPISGYLDGIEFKFKPLDSEEIYQKSDNSIVRDFNEYLSIKLHNRNIVKFNSLLIENISTYLYNIRKELLVDKEIKYMFVSDFDEKMKMEITVDRNFFKIKEIGKYKIHIKLIDKETNIELIQLHLTKKDLLLFVSLLNEILINFQKISIISPLTSFVDYETNELSLQKNVVISKIENSIVIDDVWLHGQELLNLMYVIEKLVYGFKIEENLTILRSSFRQIEFKVEEDSLDVQLIVSKMVKGEDGFSYNEKDKIKLSLNSLTISAFMLFLNPEMLRVINNEVSEKRNFISESTKPHLGKNNNYHISLKEASIGIGVQKKPLTFRYGKDKIIDNEKVLTLSGKTKHVDVDIKTGEDLSMAKVYTPGSSEFSMINKLDQFNIPLGKYWKIFVSELIKAYNGEYTFNDKLNNKYIKIQVQEPEGNVLYKMKFLSDKENKATFVLIIDKYTFEDKKLKLTSRFRQPFFEKYVYELIQIIMANAFEIEEFDTIKEIPYKELYPFEFKNKKSVEISEKEKLSLFGFKRNNEKIEFGDFKYKNKHYELSEQDKILIYLSSKFRILQGRWLPVIGEKIAISQDGYITSLHSEYKIELMKDEFILIDKKESNEITIDKETENEEIIESNEVEEPKDLELEKTKFFNNMGSIFAIEYLFATSKR